MFTTKKMNDLVMVPLFLLATVLHLTECMVYHTAFLGRNFSAPTEIEIYGFLQYQDLSEKPNVVDEVNCTWTHDSKMIKASSPECRYLIPDGFQHLSTGVKVESSEEFTLHVYQADSKGNLSDGYLAIPDEHLGKEYYVPTYCSLGGHCQIAVAGTTDSTSLQVVFPDHITPESVTCNGQSITTGDPVSFQLHENEVLHIESNESQVDLSGTYITSDNVIAVFIGARDGPGDACMIEQIPPVNKWGTELVVAPNSLNDAGDVIKIITQSPDTTIHILRYSPFTISNAGGYVELRIDWEMHSTIVATKPILVVQIMSLNIYNDTSIVKGKPAMVLVPHVEQWTDKAVKSDCFLNASGDSILTTVADSDVVPWDTYMFNITQTQINGSEYFVVKNEPKVDMAEVITSGGVNRSVYGYCKGRAAVLLAANWLWNNEECFRTRPMPGDGVDNDCDGKVDEDNCTKDDLFVNFHSTPNRTTGEIYSKTLNVFGASPIHFSVTTCGVAAVTFKVANDQRKLFTAHVSHRMVYLLLSCPGGCPNGSHFHDRQASNPCVATKQDFEIRWSISADGTEIIFVNENGTLNRTFIVQGVQLDFDVMIMAAFSSSANFTVDLPEKDCDKIISDDADNYGIEFIVPTSTSTKIFLTNANSTSVDARVYGSDGILREKPSVSPASTFMLQSALSGVLFIRASAEISVYAVHLDASSVNVYGYSVIPVDVLGPNYHVLPDSSNEECKSYSFEEYSSHKTVIVTTPYEVTSADQYLFQEGRPRAVFCGTNNYLVQIPPRESLGTQHYIPSLDIETVTNEGAEIRLVASEDSTVVTIRGNYDNLDTIDLNGDGYTREVVPNMVYNISSTKPILVLLQIKDTNNVRTSVIAIPPVRQYKTRHHLHNLYVDDQMTAKMTLRTRNAIDGTGMEYQKDIIVTPPPTNLKTYTDKTFVLDIYTLNVLVPGITSSGKVLVPGNVMYTSKKVCTITKGVPGDNIDNDCDGLVDEEQCTVDIIPGEIDADIDGALNEDCASGTTPKPVTSFKLPLREETIDCPTTSSTTEEPTNTEGNAADNRPRIVIDNGVSHDINPPTSFPQKAIQYGEGPSYTPLASSGGGIDIFGSPSTTPSPGSTAAPVETCVTDCVCPCGWVNPPKNYTDEELTAKVTEIQEKLKVSKESLSSTLRAKSSAKDDRTEAAAVGIVGVVFLVSLVGAIFLLDLTTIARDVRMLLGNLRQVYQP